MDSITNFFVEHSGYIREILLLNFGYFAVVYGRQVKVSDSPLREILLKKINNRVLNEFVDKCFLRGGIKKTRIPLFVIILNTIYTAIYFSFIDIKLSEFYWKTSIIFIVLTLVSMLMIYTFAIKGDVKRSSEKQVEKVYIEFSKDLGYNDELQIIASDLSFLGRVFNINDLHIRDIPHCKNSFDSNECKIKEKCLNPDMRCPFTHRQFCQLIELKKRNVILKLLIRKPNSDEFGYIALLGQLIRYYGEKIEIRFYTNDTMKNNFKLQARIIKKDNNNYRMASNWNNFDTTFSVPEELNSGTPIGSTYMYLFTELLWKQTSEINEEEKLLYINEYNKMISIST